MTSLLEGAKKLVSRSTDIGARIEGLDAAIVASRGRLPDALLDESQTVLERASSRLWLSADHTVVALAGATGSGKSSTFNALTGLELSAVGVRRPTTSWATACVWGADGAEDLLDWLGIPPRHRVVRNSMLEPTREDDAMRGVVLLDLPDHDSTEVSHHLEVDRLVQLADLMVWVLDPQKYADAAVHDRYLAPLATHREVMLVVLNHVDTVPPDRLESMLADVRRLLDADGLAGVPVIATSARTGEGMDELRREIASRVAKKKVVRTRLEADLRGAAQRMGEATGSAPTPKLSKERVAALEDALAESAGVPTVVKAVEDSTRLRGEPRDRLAGRRLVLPAAARPAQAAAPRPRLLGQGASGRARTSVPRADQRPARPRRLRGAGRGRRRGERPVAVVGARRARGVAVATRRPQRPARPGARRHRPGRGPDPGVGRLRPGAPVVAAARRPRWGGVARRGVRDPLPDLRDARRRPRSPATRSRCSCSSAASCSGILFALFCRLLVRATARRRARAADRRLRAAISEVADELVVKPVQDVLAGYDTARKGIDQALQ